jgi:biopolymer transport protein ExbB/biopolymer transport protein TolQ
MNWAEIMESMGLIAWTVVAILFLMSIYIIMIAIERLLTYSQARKQSRPYVSAVAEALKHGNLQEALSLGEQYNKSHLAKVLTSGLLEMQAHGKSSEIPGEALEASQRSIERAVSICVQNFKKGLSGLATIGSTAPFVGLFGTTIGIINAFQGMAKEENAGIGAVAAGISEALVTTALGLLVAVPAVWFYNIFTNKIETFTVEMDNSSSELMDYFLKKRSEGRG